MGKCESLHTQKVFWILESTYCLKITENVSFKIASEVSSVYIFSEQKFIEKTKNSQVWQVFEKLKLVAKQCYQTGKF